MRKKEMEKKIKDAFFEPVPDVLDNILKICEEEKGFVSNMKKIENKSIIKEKKQGRSSLKLVGMVTCTCLVVFSFIGLYRYSNINRIDSIVEFDVNPSIELRINKNEDVIEAVHLNSDGKKVLGDMDLRNVDLDIAVNAIIGSMIKNGYLTVDENSILVSVKNKDVEKENKLKNDISNEIDEMLKSLSIDGAILSQTLDDDKVIEEKAREYDISIGKAKLINEIVDSGLTNSKGEVYTEDSLVNLSINELNLLLTSKHTKVDNVTSNNVKASENNYIGKDKAKDIALRKANVSSNNVYALEVEFDCDDGKLVYEVEFKSNKKEYDYEIDAKTGDIIFSDVEFEEDDD